MMKLMIKIMLIVNILLVMKMTCYSIKMSIEK